MFMSGHPSRFLWPLENHRGLLWAGHSTGRL
ncbi:MAG: hypothetical protein ACI875_000224, partial [Planctomycetota bacterium]